MNTSSKTSSVVMTALMIAIITVSIMFIKFPIPLTQGYVHLGDAMIFMAVLVLGWKNGAIAAGVGAALGIPWNIGQFVVGLIIAWIVTVALLKTPAKKFFEYKFEV